MEWDPTLKGEKLHFTALVFLYVPSHFLFTFYNMGNLHLNREIGACYSEKEGQVGARITPSSVMIWSNDLVLSLNSDNKFPKAPASISLILLYSNLTTPIIKQDRREIFIRGCNLV